MMHLDEKNAEFMDFRHEEFEKQLKEIRDIVTGRNTELSAFINDKDGMISDERIDRLISDLLECLVNYKNQLSISHYKLSDETRELYQCFLYCTIQGVAYMDYIDILQYTIVDRVTTFSDILDVLYNSFTYKDRNELLYIEQLGYPIASGDTGFFRCCDLAYEILTDSNIMTIFTDEEAEWVSDMRNKQSLQQPLDDVDDAIDDDYFKQVDREQLEQKPPLSDDELFSRLYGITEEYEQLISDEEQEEWEKVVASHNEWKRSVVDPEKFIARYLRYRELFFSLDHSAMREDIEKMIDVFLYEQGLSSFALGDKYVMITYRTDRYLNTLRSEIRKAGCN